MCAARSHGWQERRAPIRARQGWRARFSAQALSICIRPHGKQCPFQRAPAIEQYDLSISTLPSRTSSAPSLILMHQPIPLPGELELTPVAAMCPLQ